MYILAFSELETACLARAARIAVCRPKGKWPSLPVTVGDSNLMELIIQ